MPQIKKLILMGLWRATQFAAALYVHSSTLYGRIFIDIDYSQFTYLDHAAKRSVRRKKFDKAQKQAEELLGLAPQFADDWNYGNAIHDANVVLGLIAVHAGNIEKAIAHLTAAGKTPGSPQLDTFGPNMMLAEALLQVSEREAVIGYLTACKDFWEMGHAQTDAWIATIQDGGTPNFGRNLLY